MKLAASKVLSGLYVPGSADYLHVTLFDFPLGGPTTSRALPG